MQQGFSMAKSLALQGAEALLNRALGFAPLALQTLSKLDGKTISLQGHSPSFTLSLLCGDRSISLSSFEEPALSDVCFSGPTVDLLRLLRQQNAQASGQNIHIEGDEHLAQRFLTLTQQLDIDWEEWLSVYLGDIAAHAIGRQGRRLGRWAKKVRQSMLRNTREYLLYESRAIVGSDELQSLSTAIDDVAAKMAHLDEGIKQLQSRLAARSTDS
ncbi:MAG TPA: SCP2 sterol-binding domain-containing protein [Pseudomonadales bacterium]|nr:SCP2 sterol-binding domain-containing protein [Pseudomonadales bacterium]